MITKTPLKMIDVSAEDNGSIVKAVNGGLELEKDLTAAEAVSIKEGQYDSSSGTMTLIKEDGSAIVIKGFPNVAAVGEGRQGKQGPPGRDGLPGRAGKSGRPGDQGCDGPKGDRGQIGPTGPTGATGSTGIQGLTGATGATGATGSIGAPGREPQYTPTIDAEGNVVGGMEVVLGSGRTMQWGRFKDSNAFAVADVLFPEAFKRVCSGVFITFPDPSNVQASAYKLEDESITPERFLLNVDLPIPLDNDWDFFWFAFGD